MGKKRRERARRRRHDGEEVEDSEEEEESGRVMQALNNLTIETAITQKEAVEQLETALEMEVEETGEGKEEGKLTERALGTLDFFTQDAEPSRTTLVDACNRFNKLSRLETLWTVLHRWPAGVKFAFN